MEYVDLLCLLTVCFVCVVNLFWSWYAEWLYFIVIKHQVLIFYRGGRGGSGNMSDVVLLLKFIFCVEVFVPMVWCLLMFGFFCRSCHPIEISR